MKESLSTISTEDKYFVPFFNKVPIAIERGEGIYVWDEGGKRYMDFTSGWGVTCLGHAHPAITDALLRQSKKIIQNPNSGLTYSPPRARLLSLMSRILPANLSRVFFSNSGAEANDAAIKLARKASGRVNVVSTHGSFHGRTISTVSATGQAKHRERFNPLMPNYQFVSYGEVEAIAKALDENTAAVILEPIQGEGGVIIPPDGYLEEVYGLCARNNTYLIVDEIQTGFCRTGSMFAIDELDVKPDFLTMAKGIAGGFPFGGFAISEEVALKVEKGDHGGTYCGNPLGCAVAYAVIGHLLENDIARNVNMVGEIMLGRLREWKESHPNLILDVRGKGLLIAMEVHEPVMAERINAGCLEDGLLVNVTQGNVIRLFPALNITPEQAEEGLDKLHGAFLSVADESTGGAPRTR